MVRLPPLPRWLRWLRLPLPRHLFFAVVGGVALYLVSLALSPFNDYELGLIALYTIAIAGLSVLTGVSGQISLGQGGFVAVGAYTLAELQTHTSYNLVVDLLAAAAVSAAAGLVIAIPATRLQGPYLAGMTLLFALALPSLTSEYSSFFGGDQGLITMPPTPPGSVDPQRWLAWIELLGALVVLVLLANLLSSRFGRAFGAVRDDEVAASLAGVHVARTKVIAFMVAAGCAGLAGAFLGLSNGFVTPGEFPVALSIYLLAGMVIGGAGTLVGAFWGAILVVYLPTEWSQSIARGFGFSHLVSANLAVIIFGSLLVVTMLVAPAGIQGGFRWVARHLGFVTQQKPSGNNPYTIKTSDGTETTADEAKSGDTDSRRTTSWIQVRPDRPGA